MLTSYLWKGNNFSCTSMYGIAWNMWLATKSLVQTCQNYHAKGIVVYDVIYVTSYVCACQQFVANYVFWLSEVFRLIQRMRLSLIFCRVQSMRFLSIFRKVQRTSLLTIQVKHVFYAIFLRSDMPRLVLVRSKPFNFNIFLACEVINVEINNFVSVPIIL